MSTDIYIHFSSTVISSSLCKIYIYLIRKYYTYKKHIKYNSLFFNKNYKNRIIIKLNIQIIAKTA